VDEEVLSDVEVEVDVEVLVDEEVLSDVEVEVDVEVLVDDEVLSVEDVEVLVLVLVVVCARAGVVPISSAASTAAARSQALGKRVTAPPWSTPAPVPLRPGRRTPRGVETRDELDTPDWQNPASPLVTRTQSGGGYRQVPARGTARRMPSACWKFNDLAGSGRE
jgi:hypothetical protein